MTSGARASPLSIATGADVFPRRELEFSISTATIRTSVRLVSALSRKNASYSTLATVAGTTLIAGARTAAVAIVCPRSRPVSFKISATLEVSALQPSVLVTNALVDDSGKPFVPRANGAKVPACSDG